MIDRVRSALQLVQSGDWSDLKQVLRFYWRSEAESVGLRRDVTLPFVAPRAAVPITIRPLRESDIPILFRPTGEHLSGEARRQRAMGLRMVRAELATCYVAVTEDDRPCYVQWLIGPAANETVRRLFGGCFPALEPDEMLLEGAFTLEEWRGKGIMADAMAQITERALDHQARVVITFVATGNIPSLKGCKKAGFEPYVARADRWRWFQRVSLFGPLDAAPSLA